MKNPPIVKISSLLVTNSLHDQAQVPIEEPQNLQGIKISGTVSGLIGSEFILSDGTGDMIIDAGLRWHRLMNISPGEELIVAGKYNDRHFTAFQITRASGEVITIRSDPDRPPWAGAG